VEAPRVGERHHHLRDFLTIAVVVIAGMAFNGARLE
jgi:hypothetical protein